MLECPQCKSTYPEGMKYCKKCGTQLVKVNLLNKLIPTIVGGAVGGALLVIIQFKAMSEWALSPQMIVTQALLKGLMGALIGAGIAISKILGMSPLGRLAFACLGGLVFGVINHIFTPYYSFLICILQGSLLGAGIGGGIFAGEVIRVNPIVKVAFALLGGTLGAFILFSFVGGGRLWFFILLGGLPGAGIGIAEIISNK